MLFTPMVFRGKHITCTQTHHSLYITTRKSRLIQFLIEKILRMSWVVTYLVLAVLCLSPQPGSVITASDQGQMTDVKVLERGDDWQCPSMEERESARSEIHQIAYSIMSSVCHGPGWRRVAFINMTDTSYNCPTGLSLTSYSKRTCGQSHTSQYGCSSITFSVGSSPYSHVCGRIRAYQWGVTTFWQRDQGINGQYVDGVSLTHGGAGRRQHICTFAAGLTEVGTSFPVEDCPCDTGNYDRVPAFVGNDYFCESGLHSAWNSDNHILSR